MTEQSLGNPEPTPVEQNFGSTVMSETPGTPTVEQYIETARELYRHGSADYRGQRNEDQQLIAEITAEEASLMVDTIAIGMTAVVLGTHAELPLDYETDTTKAGFTWEQFRGEFSRLLVGFGVMTNRLERDSSSFQFPSYTELKGEDRKKVASLLFSDFLEHNSLRFGVEGSGLNRTIKRTEYTDDGGVREVRTIVDKDVARTKRELEQNIRASGYTTDVATHPAGKISPAEYRRLRLAFPEIPKRDFDRDVGFYKNVRKELEERG